LAVTRGQLHVVLKDILKAIKAQRSLGVIAGPRSSVSALLDPLKDILAAVKPLDENTDGIEGLLSTLNGLVATDATLGTILTALGPLALEATLSSINSKASTRDGLLGTIDTDTGSIDTEITALNGKFGILGSMGALILTIELTILAINARLTEGGFNLAELVTTIKANVGTIDADTSAMNPNIAGINTFTAAAIDFQDREFGNQVWEYSETFTCTVTGTFIANWLVPAFNNWSHIRVGTQAFPLAAVENYQILAMDRATALVLAPIGRIDFQSFIVNKFVDNGKSMVLGPLNNIQISPQFGARAWVAAESFTITFRVAQHFSTALAPVPVLTGTGTFTRVLNINRVTPNL